MLNTVYYTKDASKLQFKCTRFPESVKQQDQLVIYPPQTTFNFGSNGDKDCISVITAPKSGTHLLFKIFNLLGVNHKARCHPSLAYAPHVCDQANFLPNNYRNADKVKKAFNDDEKYVITVRDPKDALVSLAYWLEKKQKIDTGSNDPELKRMSTEKRIELMLEGDLAKMPSALKMSEWAIANYFVAARIYALKPTHILFLKFEDMIGPEMGGSCKEKQIEALTTLCEFTGVKVTTEKLDALVQLMKGNTFTYTDQKKVGKWKDFFTRHARELYIERFSFIEGVLGYPGIEEIELAEAKA